MTTGGGGGNSFETISTPAGTAPVADSSTDTLTITETSFLTITGTAASDTIDITQVTTDLGTDGLIAANAVALTDDTTGNYVATIGDCTAGEGTACFSGGASGGSSLTISTGAGDPADGGAINMVNNAALAWEASPTGTDETFRLNASENFAFSGPIELDASDPADSGALRLDNNEAIAWEASPAGTDLTFTFSSSTSDFELSDDLSLTDATPHLQLIDSTASEDDFEWYADGNSLYLTNVTDSTTLLHWDGTNTLRFRGTGVTYLWPGTDGSNGQFLTTNGAGALTWTTSSGSGDVTGVGDCATGECFNGSSGTVLTFEGDAGADQTLTYDTTDDDFELNNDLTVIDASPHVQTCTTAQAKCYEMTSDGGAMYLWDVTAAQRIVQLTPDTARWGWGAAMSWTFDASSGTDNTLTFGNDQLTWGSPGQTDVTFYGGVGSNTPLLVVGGAGALLTTNSGFELQAQAGGGTDISIVAAGASATDGDFSANFSQGTLLSRTIVLDGDILGSLRFGGYDGTNYEECAFIDGRVDGTPGNNDMPEMLTFNTCADGTNTLTRRLSIRADGSMDFGNTGVNFAQDSDGQLELKGLSAGNDECLALNLDDTENDAVYSNCASSTGVTDVTFSSLDIDLEGTGPDIQWLVTGGDTLHLGCESTGCFLSNSTDGVHYFSTYSGDNHIVLGATGNVPSITLTTDGTGDGEVVLPTDSVGANELDTADSPADGEALTYQSSSGRMVWATGGGSGDITDVYNCASGDCNSIVMADGDLLNGASVNPNTTTEGIILPQNTTCTANTAEGQVCWDTDDNALRIGDGATTTSFGADTNADKEFWFPAPALLPLEAAESIPPIVKDTGTNTDMMTVDFDQTTDECRTVQLLVPPDITAGGTITFTVIWYAASVTTNNVYWDFRHNSGVADGVDPDQALTTEAAAACAAPGTAGQIDVCTWTETQTNLGWAASDTVVGVVCRDADNGSDNFAADAKMIGFGIRIPRS